MSLLKKKDTKKTEQEKVDERREEVLSQGRKFKYPLQWTRHRIVVNTILITVVILAILTVSGWLALYRLGMTDELLFRITRIVPVPVAAVDSENVLFSDYLMFYRSSMTSIERQSGSQFDDASLDQLRAEYKKTALEESEKYAYAAKLARELGIAVSEDEVSAEWTRHLSLGGIEHSEESFVKIIGDNFGLSKNEYRRMLYLSLLKAKVEAEIDESANKTADKVEKMLKENGGDFKAVADALGDQVGYQETGGLVDSKNIDGGRATEAAKLEPGKASEKFVSASGDGYYFVKLIGKKENKVNFVSLRIPFSEFNKRFETLREEERIAEYIEIAVPEDGSDEAKNGE